MRELPKGSGGNIKITKIPNQPKLKLSDPDTASDEILPEYRLDYSKAQYNRFAQRAAGTKNITLDADVMKGNTK